MPTQFAPLSWLDRLVLVLLAIAFVIFGTVNFIRSVHNERRKGDLTVYLRAAAAVRHGADPYRITDHNGWHYHYPPLLAILMVPLAESPPQWQVSAELPFPITTVLWYLGNLAALAAGVHLLARALEDRLGPPPPSSRWWWQLRWLAVLICLVPVGHTLIRAQVNLLVLALICGMAAALVRGRSGLAGLCLAGAICIKIIPASLLLYPLWKRDGRCLAGCGLGLVVGLAAIPLAVFGPERTGQYFVAVKERVLDPGLGAGGDRSRARELTDVTATHSQSIQSVAHRWLHVEAKQPPDQADRLARQLHWAVGGMLTLAVLAAAGGRRDDSPGRCVLTLGLLTTLMVVVSPVAHMHYFALNVLLVTGILAVLWEQRGPGLSVGAELLLGVYGVVLLIPHLPGAVLLRDLGLGLFATLGLVAVGLCLLGRRGPFQFRRVGGVFEAHPNRGSLLAFWGKRGGAESS